MCNTHDDVLLWQGTVGDFSNHDAFDTEAENREDTRNQPDLMMNQERNLFLIPPEERLQGTAAQLRQWLNTFQTLITRSTQEALEETVQGVNSTRDYFGEL
jgi:hypothetical protein